MTLSPGSRLGPYEIVAPLGAGGMGEVYKARDPKLDRFVAIKVLHTARATDSCFRERFEREARAIAALTHPNIVMVHSFEEHDGTPFLTMEFVEGRTLSETIPDFGLAKLTETAPGALTSMPTEQLTDRGQILGTVAYMSPEQAEGKPIDHRSDIFSLGIIFYELATGRKPFKGDSSIALLSSILRDTPAPVSELNAAILRWIRSGN
jgi:serine/threonine protein kinase